MNRIIYYLNILAAILLVLNVFPSLVIRALSTYDKKTGLATIFDLGGNAIYATSKGDIDFIVMGLLCFLLVLTVLNAYALRRKCQQRTGADRGKPS